MFTKNGKFYEKLKLKIKLQMFCELAMSNNLRDGQVSRVYDFDDDDHLAILIFDF